MNMLYRCKSKAKVYVLCIPHLTLVKCLQHIIARVPGALVHTCVVFHVPSVESDVLE